MREKIYLRYRYRRYRTKSGMTKKILFTTCRESLANMMSKKFENKFVLNANVFFKFVMIAG